MKNILRFFGFLLLLLSGWQQAQAQAPIAGSVTEANGSPVIGATVLLKGTTTGTATDATGRYELPAQAPGSYQVVVSSIGYVRREVAVTVSGTTAVNQDVTLLADVLSLSDVVVTGVANPRSKLESSVAITTLSPREIQRFAPLTTTDLVKVIPGFYAESSGGEGNGNVFARGLPSSGGSRYVQFQEDGLPVLEYGDLMFANSDIFVRLDNTIGRVEAVRGGTASVLTSNAPAGIINLISKTGGSTLEGSVRQTIGLTFDHKRTDLEFGGPLSDRLKFHVGGFYRTDDGVRSPGFTANNGGQLKANMTATFDKGYVRVYAKYLNDRAVSYLPIPLQGDPKAKGIPGFDPNFGTLQSVELMNLNVSTPFGSEVNERLDRGMNPNVTAFGAEAGFELGDGWNVRASLRNADIKGHFNAIFAADGNPLPADEYARTRFGLTNYTYSYARGFGAGQPLRTGDLAGLGGNGLVAQYGWWNVDNPLQNFSGKLEASKSFADKFTVTGGYYFNQNTVAAVWWWHNLLVNVSDNTRTLNLVDNTTGQSLTTNGYSQFGSLYRNYSASTRINAPYANVEFKPVAALSIEAGLRYDMGRTNGFTEADKKYDYDVNGDGTINRAERGVSYGSKNDIPFDYSYNKLSYSAGINYKLTESAAVFGRFSEGYRAQNDRTYAFGGTTATSTGVPAGSKPDRVNQAELGAKLRTGRMSVFATAFYSRFRDIEFSDLVADGRGGFTSINLTYNTRAFGGELESTFDLKPLRLIFNATLQDLQYQDYVYNQDTNGDGAPDVRNDFNGKQIERIPKFYFTLRPEVTVAKGLELGGTLQYFGKRFTNPGNQQELPAFGQFNADLNYAYKQFQFAVNMNNVFNTIGLTEGDPRTGLTSVNSQYFYARPIPGRSATVAVGYRF
ncbi:TonB-dependent receptor [Hymenobacter sp. IS2118]|uniref:TonB-dependent receptor n=1 Tax=Hymenobacter sp. IS2118 TaxID=1505605 RepID=UPI00054FF913|nr:TonB-dependent receptor [Hymenobacter sp. IS2118]